MACGVVGRSRDHIDAAGSGNGGTGEGSRLFDVEALGDKGCAKTELFCMCKFAQHVAWRLRRPRQCVEAKFGVGRCCAHVVRVVPTPTRFSSKGEHMNRIEIETKLNDDRTWLLNTYTQLSETQLFGDLTPSEHDPSNFWSALDHLAHLALIERNFASMIRKHIAGEKNPVGLTHDKSGTPRTRDQIMASVHAMTEEWQLEHHGKSLEEVVALGASARAITLQLLSELSDEQLEEKLPGAPWADGTIGGVLAANADHGRMHWKWAKDAGVHEH